MHDTDFIMSNNVILRANKYDDLLRKNIALTKRSTNGNNKKEPPQFIKTKCERDSQC
jgi:hypothetical protein